MPYSQFLYCEKCGAPHRLELDQQATIEAYIKEGRSSASINYALVLWDYLIYTCSFCKTSFLYTYRDVERRVREYLSVKSQEHERRLTEAVEQSEIFESNRARIEKEVLKRYGRR